MATGINPIPPGGIVSVPDAGGGAGAAVVTSQVINATWANGQQRTLDADNRINFALDQITGAPSITAPEVDFTYVLPTKPELTPSNITTGRNLYDQVNAEISTKLETAFATFQATYFPEIASAASAALTWVKKALTTGGLGINPDVEQAAWQRDRARIGAEILRTEREQMATWADRGFPLPPGALAHSVKTIRLQGAEQLAAQSRDIAIKTLEVEIENARVALREAFAARTAALSAAGDYIRTLILGPQTAMQMATGLSGLQNDFARTLTQLYSAQAAAQEPLVRLKSLDAELQMRARTANADNTVKTNDHRVTVAIEAARMCATQAAAMLNGINAGVSIGASDSSRVATE